MIGGGPQMDVACWAVNGMGHSTARQPLQALLGSEFDLGYRVQTGELGTIVGLEEELIGWNTQERIRV